jgi:hypothetical protein
VIQSTPVPLKETVAVEFAAALTRYCPPLAFVEEAPVQVFNATALPVSWVVVEPTVNPSTTTPVPVEEAFLVPATFTMMVCVLEANPVNALDKLPAEDA